MKRKPIPQRVLTPREYAAIVKRQQQADADYEKRMRENTLFWGIKTNNGVIETDISDILE